MSLPVFHSTFWNKQISNIQNSTTSFIGVPEYQNLESFHASFFLLVLNRLDLDKQLWRTVVGLVLISLSYGVWVE